MVVLCLSPALVAMFGLSAVVYCLLFLLGVILHILLIFLLTRNVTNSMKTGKRLLNET